MRAALLAWYAESIRASQSPSSRKNAALDATFTIAAGSPLAHAGQHRPGEQERSEHVHLEDAPPGCRLLLPRRAALAPDSGVVDEQVDRAELRFDGVHRRGDGGRVRDVEATGNEPKAFARRASSSPLRAATATLKPPAASRAATTSPIPRLAPVTIATPFPAIARS